MDFRESFMASHAGKSVEALWTSLTDALDACIKLISSKHSLLWIMQGIKRIIIRKRDMLYSA